MNSLSMFGFACMFKSLRETNNSSTSKLVVALQQMQLEEQTITPRELNQALRNNGREPGKLLSMQCFI